MEFKACTPIFYQIFTFLQMIGLQKLWKMFLFQIKGSFRSWDIQIFVFLSSLFFSLSAIALEVVQRQILKFMASSTA